MSTQKPAKKSFVLQVRDLALLRGLFECRVMTAAHVAALYFEGREEATKKRLQTLKAAGLVKERGRLTFEPAVLSLAKGGIELLRDEGVLREYPPLSLSTLLKRAEVSDQTIKHERAVMDVKVAFHSAVRGIQTLSIAEFGTWPRLYEFSTTDASRGPVRPDGFIRIREVESDGSMSEHSFFLEVDRSTESLDTLVGKATDYLNFYRSGGFAARNGAARSAFKDYPFRVLMVFKTAERRNNVANRLLIATPPILTHVLLSTAAEVMTDPFGTVWIRPLDYRNAMRGSVFETETPATRFSYRRNGSRENLSDTNSEKQSIIM